MRTEFQSDLHYENDMMRGSRWLRDAIKSGETSHTDLRWVNRIAGATWQSGEEPPEYRSEGHRRALKSAAEKEFALARRVYRDPCPVCATRADIGCKHQRVS